MKSSFVFKRNRSNPSSETNVNTILKKVDVFINRRQMKLLNHQKRLDDLQRDLLLSECESSRNRLALERKDIEVRSLSCNHAVMRYTLGQSITSDAQQS